MLGKSGKQAHSIKSIQRVNFSLQGWVEHIVKVIQA